MGDGLSGNRERRLPAMELIGSLPAARRGLLVFSRLPFVARATFREFGCVRSSSPSRFVARALGTITTSFGLSRYRVREQTGTVERPCGRSPPSGWRRAFGLPYDPREPFCTGRSHSAHASHERARDNLRNHRRMRGYSYPRYFEIGRGSEGSMKQASASPAATSVKDTLAALPPTSVLGQRVSL
jgi:hypothetical protein